MKPPASGSNGGANTACLWNLAGFHSLDQVGIPALAGFDSPSTLPLTAPPVADK
jgi:hypothetical protein